MMKNKMSKDNFSLMVILLIPVAIAINIVGGQLTSVLKIPVDLDTIGVILVGLLAGPIPYAICAFYIGIAAGLLAKYNMTNKVWKLVISGIVIAIVATLTATPVTVFFFGGSTGGGASMLAAGLMATGQRILQSVFSVYIVTESIGKMLSIFVAYLIIRAIPARSLVKYRFGDKYITKTASSGK